jgi:alginate O-acetyltransferase complex protein AlgI
MLFNSIQFLIFFPIVTVVFFLLPHKYRWFHLLVASCLFYMAFIPVYILILLFTILIDYIAGIVIENATGKKKKYFLSLSIVANVGVLAFFKYYNFFTQNIDDLISVTGGTRVLPLLHIILPIGLSFHTFQAMSYTIEVYRGRQKAERHPGIYALYVMFYPQLVAGPIERPQNVLHQFHEKKYFNYKNATSGLRLIMWGMFKKVVIADRLALLTDPVFNHPHNYTPLALAIAAIFFSFQIFCDFSGYSDIALGTARVMGFSLMQNFNKPYHARTVSEFWSRWHISLSTWFRDYVYIPLGGNRVSVPRWYFNLFFVFLLSGFWHGANWTFIVWGGLHGFYLIFAIVSQSTREKISTWLGITRIGWLYTLVQVFTTYCLVTLAWVFFRANTLKDAVYIITKFPAAGKSFGRWLLSGHLSFNSLKKAIGEIPMYIEDVTLCFLLIFILETVHFLQRKYNITDTISKRPIYIRWSIYYVMIMIIIFFGVYGKRQFIYFQF